MSMRIAVVGASGFVGSTLVERLLGRPSVEVVPFIHSTGNAWRLARWGLPLHTLDLLDARAVTAALKGCTHVVNCSRGGNDVMFDGLRHLLTAARAQGVKRFVHLSSVMFYGDPPSPDSTDEDGRTEPDKGTYGWVKLEQDRMVAKAAGEGLAATVLCPPNISGAYSGYIGMIFDALRHGELALLDDGHTPCNVVDVQNLCHAIELGLTEGPGDGRRLFVTDDHPTTWRHIVDELRELLPEDVPVPAIGREELQAMARPPAAPRIALHRSLLHLVSSDVRQALRRDPLWARVDDVLRGTVRALGERVEGRLRLSVAGPIDVPRARAAQVIQARLCVQQLRGVTHSCDRARRTIGYVPPYTFEQSVAALRDWFRVTHRLRNDFTRPWLYSNNDIGITPLKATL